MRQDFEKYADAVEEGLREDGLIAYDRSVPSAGGKNTPAARETGASVTFAPFVWEEPETFDDMKLPDFPTWLLPRPLEAMTENLAEFTQTPEEMSALLTLGVLAAVLQRRYDVCVTPGWTEPLCLYCAAVAPPGERKSAVLSALTGPLRDYEAERQALEAADIARNRCERIMLEKNKAAAESAVSKSRSSLERENKRQEALDLAARLAEFSDMYEYRLLADDATPEKLIDLMAEQNGCITLCSAEGGLFDAMRGRYDRNLNIDVYLKAHAGDAVTVDRIGRRGNRIERPRLTMLLTIQPDVLTGLMENPAFRGRGLCGRFLYVICRSKIGRRSSTPEPVPESVLRDYRDLLYRLLSGDETGTMTLSPEADRVRCEYQDQIEKKLGDEWECTRDWGGKLVGAAVRIAALLHCAHATDSPLKTPIDPETMEAAARIADFFGAHAAAAYMTMGASVGQEDARYLWHRIRRADADRISRRDLFAMCRTRFRHAEDMAPALKRLTDMGYIRETVIGTGGRPTNIIEINPLTKDTKGTKATKALPAAV